MEQKTFIFIGRSGCGKDTQMELLEKLLNEKDPDRKIVKVKTGSALREFWEEEGYSAELSRKINEEGGLQPEFLVICLWGRFLLRRISGNEHLIFDGTPRKLNEAETLGSALKFYKRENPTVIYMNVSRDWAVDKLTKRGRSDDTIEQIGERQDWFDKEVIPTLEYLKNEGSYKFLDINGEQTIPEVFDEILTKLGMDR